jgi:tetratricopeptide (TPR) repeat protein
MSTLVNCMMLLKWGQHKEAIQCYDKSLKLSPNNAIDWNNKGNSLDSLGKYEEAIQCYDKTLSINPNYIKALNNKKATAKIWDSV